MVEQFPIYIPTRDRLAPLLELLDWLESVDQHEIYLVDNLSTYAPLLEYFERTPYRVLRLDHNLGHRSPFLTGVVQRSFHDRYFIVTDPDVVPDEGCPPDALSHFRALFDEFPEVHKVGFGLRIDDLPDCFALRDEVVQWEKQFWQDEVEPGVFRAAIDTTFAMYRPLGQRHDVSRALRTGPPYVARHIAWYVDSANLDDDESYYRAHADPTISNWNRDELSRWKQRRLASSPSPVEADEPASESSVALQGLSEFLGGARRSDAERPPPAGEDHDRHQGEERNRVPPAPGESQAAEHVAERNDEDRHRVEIIQPDRLLRDDTHHAHDQHQEAPLQQDERAQMSDVTEEESEVAEKDFHPGRAEGEQEPQRDDDRDPRNHDQHQHDAGRADPGERIEAGADDVLHERLTGGS